MSLLHFKHFAKGKRGKVALKELYSNMFLHAPYYSPTQYRLVLVEFAISSSCSGLSSDKPLLENMNSLQFSPSVVRTRPFLFGKVDK